MGTHPIFESDFDCLTETYILLKKMKEKIEYERKNLKLDYGAKEKIEYERKNLKLDYGAKVIDGGIIDNNFVKQYHNFKIEKDDRRCSVGSWFFLKHKIGSEYFIWSRRWSSL